MGDDEQVVMIQMEHWEGSDDAKASTTGPLT